MNKPIFVKIALLYFILASIIQLLVTTIAIFQSSSPFAILFIILSIPFITGIVTLFNSPKKWHHTYCSILGNITGFSGIIGSLLNLIYDSSFIQVIPQLLFSGITVFIFLSFDFNKDTRKYFGK